MSPNHWGEPHGFGVGAGDGGGPGVGEEPHAVEASEIINCVDLDFLDWMKIFEWPSMFSLIDLGSIQAILAHSKTFVFYKKTLNYWKITPQASDQHWQNSILKQK